MADEQKEQKSANLSFVDSTYKLVELGDEMEQAKANVEKLIKSITRHIEVLEASKDESFKDTITTMKGQAGQYQATVKYLTHRRQCLKNVLAILNNGQDITIRFVVSQMLEAFGIVNPEGKTLEERDDFDKAEEKAAS